MLRMTLSAAAVAAGLLGPAAAETSVSEVPCAEFGMAAEALATIRQDGVPLSDAMGVVDQFPADEGLHEVLKALALDAYELPRKQEAEARETIIIDFRRDAEAACYEWDYD